VLAVIAAVIFGLDLLLDLANVSLGNTITTTTLLLAGLLCLALHLAGVGGPVPALTAGGRRWRRR
jgi:hypothetical protein